MKAFQTPGNGIIGGGGTWLPLLVTLAGYFVLNKGYAYIGYLPIFTGELTMMFYFIRLRHGALLPKFFRTPAGRWWAVFLAYNLFTFLRSGFHDPRDAVQNSIWWVYAVFLYIGFCFGRKLLRDGNRQNFEKFLLFTAYAAVLNGLMAPASSWLHGITAFLYSGNSLLGTYSSYDASLSGLTAYFLYARNKRFHAFWIALGLFVLAFLLESRAGMLEMIVIFPYSLFVDRQTRIFYRLKQMFIALVLLIAAFTALDITHQGKHGIVSIETVEDSVYSIFFEDNTANLQGTKDSRLIWWGNVVHRTCASAGTFFFGMGESVILNSTLNRKGNVDRYPHNSFISSFGFTGLIGLILFTGLIVLVGWGIFKASRRAPGNVLLRWYPAFAIGYLIAACFSTVFEAPFHSCIFWTISGIAYHFAVMGEERAKLSGFTDVPATGLESNRRDP